MISPNGPLEARDPVSGPVTPEQLELARLRQENERLGQRLAAAEAVIEIHKTRFGAVGPGRAAWRQRRALLMASATELASVVGVRGACQAVGVGRASFYRHARRLPAGSERGDPREVSG